LARDLDPQDELSSSTLRLGTEAPAGNSGHDARAPILHVRFGGIDVAVAVRNFEATTSIEDLPAARFRLDVSALPDDPIDYLAEVRISAEWEGAEQLIFTGAVISAERTDEGDLAVDCRGGVALDEQLMPQMASWDMRAADLIHLIARAAGFPETRLQIEGLDALPREVFEVTCPLTALAVTGGVHIGAVQFSDAEASSYTLFGVEPPKPLKSQFTGASAYAVACVTARTAFDAERAALLNVDTALSWLAARARYGLVRLPAGEVRAFARTETRALPSRLPVLHARGVQSGRRWLRSLAPAPDVIALALGPGDLPLTRWLRVQDHQALLAWRRAVTSSDPLGTVTALWDAIEYYAAEASVPTMFSNTELELLRAALPAGLSNLQRERALEGVAALNSPPLMTRLRAALTADGVPVSDGELGLLQRLRKLRNKVVHGRSVETPENEELEHAMSIVSRMLTYRLERRREWAEGAPRQDT
jgi:hypothetical protein